MWFCPETPALVVIDESVELAKDYAGEASGSFINGILDWVYKHDDREKPNQVSDAEFGSEDDAPVKSPEDTGE